MQKNWIEKRTDVDTGEISEIMVEVEEPEKVNAIVLGRPRQMLDKEFVKVYPAFFSSFLQELKIDDGKARLAWYFVYKALRLAPGSDNIVYADNEELMKVLNMSKPTVIKYINELCSLNVVKRIKPRIARFQVNPEMIYRGNLVKYQANNLERADGDD